MDPPGAVHPDRLELVSQSDVPHEDFSSQRSRARSNKGKALLASRSQAELQLLIRKYAAPAGGDWNCSVLRTTAPF